MQMASLLPDTGNTQNAVEQEPYVDVEMEVLMLMSNVRRKRPGPSRSKKNAKISKFDDSLERIVIILEGEKNEEERKEKERKDEERKEEERKEKERKEEEMKEKDKERKVEEMKQDALFQQYENENISLEASNNDDNGISDTDTAVDIVEQMEMSEVRDAIADALFQS
ncbi:hypothetical protein MRB53_001587 [Persea americana]|uniref:Uncharacterized protein n=1 Tax=Persea americana TaxID=3435 RepID=A0ACC2MS83_PERAE|nr:hypothetical protein MRB53_001587 [Persea americana]